MHSKAPIVKDLVLLGGGHSHVEVVRNFGMKPMPGVRVTLVTRDVVTPYSGMLPGYVSGFYSKEDCHIDLARLTAWAGVRMVCEEACGLDVQNRRLQFKERPALAYDALSINIGITPGLNQVPGAAEHCTPVKPIDGFVRRLDKLLQRAQAAGPTAPLRVVVVGGGAGGVEIALAVQYRLDQLRQSAGADCTAITVTLVCRGRVLASHTSYARASLLAILAQRGVVVREFMRVSSVTEGRMQLQPDGPGGSPGGQVSCEVEFEECLWCTQAAAPSWLKTSGLPTDPQGFLAVDPCLHSQGGPLGVFAAGDVASCAAHPRPKAGVFAVRQGPPLAANLRRFLLNQPLQPFVPQATFLSLITTGDRYCVGTKGWMGLQGRWMWWWKDSIDRAFMRKYGDDLPVMAMGLGSSAAAESAPPALAAAGPDALALLAASKMRCGGCGSKVGASVLSRALARLPAAVTGSHVVAGLESPDDAALLRPPPHGKLLVQTLDFFKVVWDDPYVFGKIAATHALGDVWAMGGQPRSALALAVVPLMAESKVEEELVAMMAGALQVLNDAGCSLVGGHTSEGSDLSLGFCVTGEVSEESVMRKGGLAPGQVLLLTKALGTGTIMAACMQGKAKGAWVASALASMTTSSAAAATILSAHGCKAATDVTGFGLVGHLVEMTRASGVAVSLQWDALPLLPGAADCLEQGLTSSLHTANAKAAAAIANFDAVLAAWPTAWRILVDPQTAGGLLGALPPDTAVAAQQALREAGYVHTAIIGKVEPATALVPPVTIILPQAHTAQPPPAPP